MLDEPQIQYLGDVQKLKLKPGDMLVFKYPGKISDVAAKNIKESLTSFFAKHGHGEVPLLFLEEGADIGILAKEV